MIKSYQPDSHRLGRRRTSAWSMIVLITSVALLSACQASDISVAQGDAIEITMYAEEQLAINQPVELAVALTQQQQPVEDAGDVQIELWKKGERDGSRLVQADSLGDGWYGVTTTFESNGIYVMQTHITARGTHLMPKRHLVVGEVSEEELKQLDQTVSEDDGHGGGGHDH
ncbi:FixH family protein [Marinicrinis sediminis]|uniref:FixH family protein n=1 Tax=Marinicrinis sediminis TaxID=1652465 RepID=A0ABW5RG23_9BACL